MHRCWKKLVSLLGVDILDCHLGISCYTVWVFTIWIIELVCLLRVLTPLFVKWMKFSLICCIKYLQCFCPVPLWAPSMNDILLFRRISPSFSSDCRNLVVCYWFVKINHWPIIISAIDLCGFLKDIRSDEIYKGMSYPGISLTLVTNIKWVSCLASVGTFSSQTVRGSRLLRWQIWNEFAA